MLLPVVAWGDPPIAAGEPQRVVGTAAGKGILIDGIHANDLTEVCLEPGVYEYHTTCGYRRSFEYLRSRGVKCDRATEGRLDAKRLAPYRLLFINLVSAERKPFLVSEIAAIREFVSLGGSLFVVTDHTNAYFHAHAIEPLLTELDIRTHTNTACDVSPQTISGSGWITITRFTPHPVTAGLRCIAMQSGSSVDRRFAVALTSDEAWEDAWLPGYFCEGNAPGFSGNFQRDPGEASGPLGVVMAKDFGRGRIVVVGDQNMLGSTFGNYADNYRLWLNSIAWLLDDPRLAQPEPYETWRRPRIFCYEDFAHGDWGSSEIYGSYHAWVLLSRDYWTFANDHFTGPCELVVFSYNDLELPPAIAAATAAHLRRGKNVLVLDAGSSGLWDEPGVVAGIVKAMGLSRPETHAEQGKLVIRLPAAGEIHVLGPDKILDNGVLPWPHSSKEEDKQRGRLLLDAVRDALGPDAPK